MMPTIKKTGTTQPVAKKQAKAAPTQQLGTKPANAGGYGTDTFTKGGYALASAGDTIADRRKGVEEAFGRARDLAGSPADAFLSPTEAEGIQLRLDQVAATFGASDVTTCTREVTALLWRVRQGETGPDLGAAAIATKLEGLFGFYEAKMYDFRFNKAMVQALENAIVNTGRKLADVRPAAKPAVEAPASTTPVATPDPTVTRFAALGHNGHASKAAAAELGGLTDALLITSYAFGARGDALRPAIGGLASVALESQRGNGVPPVEVAERARGALAAIETALKDAPAGEREILEKAAKGIKATLDGVAARFAPMTSEAFWAEQRANEAKAREAAGRAAAVASTAVAGAGAVGVGPAVQGPTAPIRIDVADMADVADLGIRVAGAVGDLAGVGEATDALTAQAGQVVGQARKVLDSREAQVGLGLASKALAAPPAAPERLLFGIPAFRIPGWMSFQNFKPAYDLAATQAASWGGPYGAAAAATYGILSRFVPEDW